ncbi:uncharacterized protein LOC129587921 [Paramacrobiotus metropolitanus]|uniref:uncharacterized protein LOC129587921 n=1 Tax=Paramacrobiotus metropolitanus TaxID=2943436 RepID=UPI002445CBFA|nr:uncharacterized protein LOC129587921 [Paramacrobiotus metropolitanus]
MLIHCWLVSSMITIHWVEAERGFGTSQDVSQVLCYECNTQRPNGWPKETTLCKMNQKERAPQDLQIAGCFKDYCAISYATKPGHLDENGKPWFQRGCLPQAEGQQIASRHPFSPAEALVCGPTVDPDPNLQFTVDCLCEGEYCNWFPLDSVMIALDNVGKDPSKRRPIPYANGSIPAMPTAPTDAEAGDGTGQRGGDGAANGTDNDSTAKESRISPVLVGAIAGALVVALLVGCGCMCWRQHQKKRREEEEEDEDEEGEEAEI